MTHITIKALHQLGLTDKESRTAMTVLYKSQLSGEQIGMHRGYKVEDALPVFRSKAGGTTKQAEASRKLLEVMG